MARREIEIIEYDRIQGLNMFMDTVDYRTPHQHDELELIWNLTGVLHVGSMGGNHVLAPGSIILINREVIHEFHGEQGGATFLCMQLDLSRFRSARGSGQILFDAFLPEEYLSAEEMTSVKKDILSLFETYLKEEADYGIYCASMAGLILYRLLKAMPHHEETLQEAGDRIQKSQRMQRLLDYVDQGYMHKIRLSDCQAGRPVHGISVPPDPGYLKPVLPGICHLGPPERRLPDDPRGPGKASGYLLCLRLFGLPLLCKRLPPALFHDPGGIQELSPGRPGPEKKPQEPPLPGTYLFSPGEPLPSGKRDCLRRNIDKNRSAAAAFCGYKDGLRSSL